MTKKFDLVAIGTGSAAATMASRCRSAEETIHLLALASKSGLRAEELKAAIFAYPTHASDVGHML